MSFANYMWNLLTRPFKNDNSEEISGYTIVIGAMLDEAKMAIFNMRKQWFIKSASSAALRLLGEERGIYRGDGESLANYRFRVMAAFEMYAAGGTIPGILAAITRIGYKTPIITERTKSWAHFTIAIDLYVGLLLDTIVFKRLNNTVLLMKPAHTLPIYLFNFRQETGQGLQLDSGAICEGDITSKHNIWYQLRNIYRLDGTLNLDGSITLGAGWLTSLYLDGNLKLDGNSLLDGYTALVGDGWRWSDNVLNRSSINVDVIAQISYPELKIWLDGYTALDGTLKLDGTKVKRSNGINIVTNVELMNMEELM